MIGTQVSSEHARIASLVAAASPGAAAPMLHASSSAPAALYPSMLGDMARIGGLLFGILPAAGGVRQVTYVTIMSTNTEVPIMSTNTEVPIMSTNTEVPIMSTNANVTDDEDYT
jgi:alanine racemase